MRQLQFVVVTFLLLAGAVALASRAPLKACGARVPASLRERLLQEFPAYRIAEVSDYSKDEGVEQHKQHFNGNPCFSVASADVNGDGRQGFGLIIVDGSRDTLLIAARNVAGKRWKIYKLSDFGPEGYVRAYVDPLDPGLYDDMYAPLDKGPSDYVPEPGRVPRFKATHAGFIAGTIEATGVGYFFTGIQWCTCS